MSFSVPIFNCVSICKFSFLSQLYTQLNICYVKPLNRRIHVWIYNRCVSACKKECLASVFTGGNASIYINKSLFNKQVHRLKGEKSFLCFKSIILLKCKSQIKSFSILSIYILVLTL